VTIFHAILLGIIEGLTEFLPISSTGHLIIAEQYIHFKDTAKVFTITIQMGAILAVIWHYRVDLIDKLKGAINGRHTDRQFLLNILIASIPAGILGLALEKKFDDYAKAGVVATALILGGIVLWLVDRKIPIKNEPEKVNLNHITYKQSLIIGFIQCFALVPGTSRSGSTIVGGLFAGLNRVTATAFSFYLAIPILLAAGLHKLMSSGGDVSTVDGGYASILIGTIVSFIVALAAISWLLKYVSTHSFRIFVYYRIILGILVLLTLA
jgi:undecaprenyl-diphosphatase